MKQSSAVLILFALLAVIPSAQGQTRPSSIVEGRLMAPHRQMADLLIHNKSVQIELSIKPEQLAAIERGVEAAKNTSSEAYRDPGGTTELFVGKVLTAVQIARFREIIVQQLGLFFATDDPELSEKLQMSTDTQQEPVRAITKSTMESFRSFAGPREARALFTKHALDKADAAIFAILTPLQKAKWKSMCGKPFVLKPL